MHEWTDEESAAIVGAIARPPAAPWADLAPVWAAALATMQSAARPGAYTTEQWAVVVGDATRLVWGWGEVMKKLMWCPEDIRRLLPLLRGRQVLAVRAGEVQVVEPSGVKVRIFRRPVPGKAPVWQEGRRTA